MAAYSPSRLYARHPPHEAACACPGAAAAHSAMAAATARRIFFTWIIPLRVVGPRMQAATGACAPAPVRIAASVVGAVGQCHVEVVRAWLGAVIEPVLVATGL